MLLILILAVLSVVSTDNEQAGLYQLMLPGQYHGRDCPVQSGEKWWCIVQTKTGQELRPVAVDVEMIRDLMMSDEENQKTGKIVSAKVGANENCLFFVRGLKNPIAGPIPAFFSGSLTLWPRPKSPDFSPFRNEINLGRKDLLVIWADGSMDKLGRDYKLNVYRGRSAIPLENEAQCIFESPTEFDYAIPKLLWVGDIDRDGKPDLLVDLTTKYVGRVPTLFLSSESEKGKLIKQVAELVIGAD